MHRFCSPFSLHFGLLGLALLLSSMVNRAEAQYGEYAYEKKRVESPEWVAWELKVGLYRPDVGNEAFEDIFGGDRGPLLMTEIDVWLWRIPYVGLIGPGLTFGWAGYSESALDASSGSRVSEDVSFNIFPFALLGILRIDVLARELGVPLVLSGKIGLDVVPWRSSKGGSTEGDGVSLGLRWAAQLAFELDIINPQGARTLDDEWGINHTYLFFELLGSTADTSFPVGDKLAWVAGLGFTF